MTPQHCARRLLWATQRTNLKTLCGLGTDDVHIHIDEKWFYSFKLQKRLYLPPRMVAPPLFLTSKTQIPKVMFLAAVGFPRPDHAFNGQIGIWEIMEEKIAKKNSKHHSKGDVYLVNSNLNGKSFALLLKEKVVPEIIHRVGHWAKRVIIQMDSAGGHSVLENLEELNQWGKNQLWYPPNSRRVQSNRTVRHIDVQFVTQPTRSPDLNVLDLGAWNSLQSVVEKVKYEGVDASLKIHERLRLAVKEAWNHWCCEKVVSSLFETLLEVNRKVVIHQGTNNFDIHK